MDIAAQAIPTSLDEIMEVAERERVSPAGFTDGYSPKRHQGKENPYGLPQDWRDTHESYLEAVGLCRAWIRQIPRRKTVNTGISTSYGFKHSVERYYNTYIPNGAFIVAAYMEGLSVRRTNPDSPNAYFNISSNVRKTKLAA
jgi:hypothetical protein